MEPDKIIRAKDLPNYVGLRQTQIDVYVKSGDFPKPIKLGAQSVGWLAREIAEWQRKRIEARDAEAAKPKGEPKRGPGRPRKLLVEG